MARVSAMSFTVLLITVLTISVPASALKPDNRTYEEGEYIPLFANMLQPTLSRCEVYPYFSLPFCPPGFEIPNRKKSLDEVLLSDCFTNTRYELRFKEESIVDLLCEKNLTKDDVARLRDAIDRKFEFQMCFNNILMWGSVGKINHSSHLKPKYYLVKHIEFQAYYLKNRVKDIRLWTDFDSAVDITEDVGIIVGFTYSVYWKDWTELPVELAETALLKRTSMIKYQWPTEEGILWPTIPFFFSVSVIFAWAASVFLVFDLYLRNYFTRNISNGEAEEVRQGDMEEGRVHVVPKQIHGDNCRCPPHSSLLGAVVGVGTQQLILICMFFLLSYAGVLHPCNREELIGYYLLIYSITSVVSGYTATSFHSRYNATGWKQCVFHTGVLYFVPAFITYILMNFLAHKSIRFSDLPFFRTIVGLCFTWGVGTVLLVTLGGKIGHDYRRRPRPICATSRIPRLAHGSSWHTRAPAQVFLGGLIPFVTMIQEMDNIYASLLYQKVCGAFSTLFKAFVHVVVMTALVGIAFTYVQLSNHDHHWWWRSVLRGGSTAVFMFLYGIYYFARAAPGDPAVIFIILGENACMFYGFSLALGTVGFCASLLVFRCVYRRSLKNE